MNLSLLPNAKSCAGEDLWDLCCMKVGMAVWEGVGIIG